MIYMKKTCQLLSALSSIVGFVLDAFFLSLPSKAQKTIL